MNSLAATILSALICCAICAFAASAQTQKHDSEQTIKIDTTLVSVPVIVSDRQGRHIAGLKASDFTLYEDRVKQPIVFFADTEEPINVALLLDTSKIEERNEDAMDFLRRLSEVSAGRYFNSEVANLKQTFERIVEELRHQYRLGFYPPDHPAGSIHTIKVEVGSEVTGPDVIVRSRRSYRVAQKRHGE